jgi:SpoVK/Ycf46/Vps4 family AAA+-type ATPase
MRLLKDLGRASQSSKMNQWVQVVVVDRLPAAEGFIEVELELPNADELKSIVKGMLKATAADQARTDLGYMLKDTGEKDDEGKSIFTLAENDKLSDEEKQACENRMRAVLDALLGLEDQQAQQALAISLAESGTIKPETLFRSKKALIKSEALEWIDPDIDGLDDIGGLELLKGYLVIEEKSFIQSRREKNVPRPRGLLIAGIPGTGKSLTAKCVGVAWNIPLLRLNIGALFGKFVGESESKWRKAKEVIEAIAPCALWIDEIEKGIQGFGGGGSASDGGTTARVGNDFLTWLAECQAPVYIIATANNPMAVPAEFFRAGRFDARFWVDVPNHKDRVAVLEVVAKKWRCIAADKFISEMGLDYEQIADELRDYAAAEIEQALIDGLKLANYEERDITTEDVLQAAKQVRPVIRSWEKDKILNDARSWGENARPANNPKDEDSEQPVQMDGVREVFTGPDLSN